MVMMVAPFSLNIIPFFLDSFQIKNYLRKYRLLYYQNKKLFKKISIIIFISTISSKNVETKRVYTRG
jgi:hypothetical protein